MRTIFKLLSLLIIFISSFSPAFSVDIEKGFYQRDQEERPGIRIYLEAETDAVKDAFVDFLKKNYDFKLKGNGWFANKEELYAKKVIVQKIIDKQMDFFAEIIPVSQGASQTQITLFASLGYDIYLNEQDYPAAYQDLYNLGVAFLENFIPDYFKEHISTAKKDIKKLEKTTQSLSKDIDQNEKDIKKMYQEIQDMQAALEEKNAQLENLKVLLEEKERTFQDAKRDLSRIN